MATSGGGAMNAIKLVVCDMAGTTVKDSGEVARAFTAALAEHGVEASAAQISAVRGASKREAIAMLTAPKYGNDSARVEAVYSGFKQHLQRVFTRDAEPVAGAVETFAWLRERGIQLALNTGFDRDITTLLIDALGWQKMADAVISGDDVPNGKGRPAPYMIFRAMEATGTVNMRHVLNVGDTVSDLQAAHNAGVGLSVGVLSGAHTREQLVREPHTHLIASVAALPALWG
jgi:phosphonatase-like hydrolase